MEASYALGLFFILLVNLIWSLASILVQYIYTDQKFDSPFLLTYIGTTLFVLLIPTRLIWERRRKILLFCKIQHEDDGNSQIIPWKQGPGRKVPDQGIAEDELQGLVVVENPGEGEDQLQEQPDDISLLSHQEHFMIALKIAPAWFIANWTFNASLEFTSITSATVLASTGSVFTFLFAVFSADEKFTLMKLAGVLLGVNGSVFVGWNDASHNHNEPDTNINTTLLMLNATQPLLGTPHHHNYIPNSIHSLDAHSVWGDALGLISAIGYGVYTVMVRLWCPREEQSYSMQLMLGYIGLVNGIVLSPVAAYVVVHNNLSAVPEQHITWLIFGFLVVKGLFDNVISDYLWARAVVLTSATIATVGLGFTIPLAFLSDLALGHKGVLTVKSTMGALSVLLGFTLVNLGNTKQEEEETPTETTNDSRVT